MPDPFDRHLKVGVLLDSLVVPRWVHSCLTALQASDFARIELVVLNGSHDPAPTIASRLRLASQVPLILYSKLDHRLFRRKVRYDAFTPTPIGDLLTGASMIVVIPRRGRFVDRLSDDDVGAIRAHDVDVLLRFGFRIIRGGVLDAARFGTWSYHHGDNRLYRGGPPLLWEMIERTPVSGTVLQILTEDLDAGRVIYRSLGKTDFTSLFRNRNDAYWKAARFVERRLRDLHRLGPDALMPTSTQIAEIVPSKRITRSPGPWLATAFAIRTAGEIVLGQVRHQTTNGHWFVAWAPRELGLPGLDHAPRFREVPSPPGRFLADPFLAEHEGRTFVFVESCPHRRAEGVIAVLELTGESVSEPVTVLERAYHLSYPAVFRWENEWFMTPETAANHTVELYRAVEFPWRWELDTVLLSDVNAVDPTVFANGGRWWLSANVASFGASTADEMHLFWAAAPRGPFTPHVANPVVSDIRRARPAGMPFREGGRLYRPSQNSALRYGHSIMLNRMDRLDTEAFQEEPIGQVLPTWMPGAVCTHTLNMTDRFIVADGMRWSPRSGPSFGRRAREVLR